MKNLLRRLNNKPISSSEEEMVPEESPNVLVTETTKDLHRNRIREEKVNFMSKVE